jgi:endonuclease/exonuclease/phosphatase family metal-dependent hydrolase
MGFSVRIATFNLENLDADPTDPQVLKKVPSLATRIRIMQPQLMRLRADILCLQEVNGQDVQGGGRKLDALEQLLKGTPYADYHLVTTHTAEGANLPFKERNLVTLSRYPITQQSQVLNDYVAKPRYRQLTAVPPQADAKDIGWERPLLYAQIALGTGRPLHVINGHLKSKLPTFIDGQYVAKESCWRTASAWAEGYFISSMKRVGQALEARRLIDKIFDEDSTGWIVMCGDFNSDCGDVPVNAIRGPVEETGNASLGNRVMVPCEFSVPESARYSLLHLGEKTMLDHILASRGLLTYYRGTEIHNEVLPDESGAFRTDVMFPESDHAPVVADFEIG